MAKERVPEVPKKSAHSAIRSAWYKALKESGADADSLKAFARKFVKSGADLIEAEIPLMEKCKDWLFNKGANFSKPPLGIGSTRKKKSDVNNKKKS